MRFAIIGGGTMGRVHAEALGQIEGVTVVAFGAPEVAPATVELATRLGAEVLPSAEEVLARPDIDAVVVATPTDTHCTLAVAAARAGKQIFCEKPLARTLEDGAAMLDAAARAGVRLAVGQVVRYFPEYALARELVVRGELGTPGVARTTRGAGFPRVSGDWYADLARSGGVVLDMMIHDFDWLRWTLGPIDRLYARGLASTRRADRDAAMAVLRFHSGALGYVEGSWAYPGGFRTSLEISGSAGLLRTTSRGTTPLQFEFFPTDGTDTRTPLPPGGIDRSPYLAQMRDVVRWFAGGPAPRCTAEEAFEALRIALAALESARTGRPAVLAGAA